MSIPSLDDLQSSRRRMPGLGALSRAFRGGESKDVPSTQAESKVILSSYYAALAGSGITLRGQGSDRAWSVERAVAEGYSRVVWCFKPVQVISGNSASLPFRLKQGEETVDDHPLYRVLNKQANPLETGQVFRKRLSAQVLLSRRGAFVEVTKSNGGTVKRLDLLPPGRTRPVAGTGEDPISHFEITPLGGGEPRQVEPERVRWVRDPHPIDPYGAITPLEAAGLSIELDYFARLYNVSFMRNDGRPGGILGIKPPENGGGEIDEAEMDRLESRFGKGPVEAGKLSVISGDLSYVDVAARPRDLQYQATSKNAKTEMLVAFGVPESQLGNAADRTYANAEEEGYAFWTQTMAMHNAIILSAFDMDSEDEFEPFFDTSRIEVLQRPEIARRAEAREEVAAGLRSIHSYMSLAGIEDEAEDTAFTRALWLPAGKTPIPAREEDAEALGVGAPAPAPEEEGLAPEGDPDAAPPGTDPEEVVAGEQSPGGGAAAPRPAGAPEPQRSNLSDVSLFDPTFASLEPSLSVVGQDPPRRRVMLAVARETKAADDTEGVPSSDLDESLAEQVEAEVAAALAAVTERQVERAIARLKSPRERKGTRHWTPEFKVDTRVGDKALDASRIAGEGEDPDSETDAVRRVLERGAVASAVGLLSDLTTFGGKTPPARVLRRVNRTVSAAMRLVNDSVRLQRQRIADTINRLDQAGKTVEEIVEALRNLQQNWSEGLAVQAATAALEGAREAAAASLTPEQREDIVRVWRSRRDDAVRASHQRKTKSNPLGADGQKRGLDEPFVVGGAVLRYPGDPAGPPREVANCFPAETLVGGARVTGAYRQWYEGPMVTVLTESGCVLTGTPNHPVLTDRGWVHLGGLDVSRDHVGAVVGDADHSRPATNTLTAPHVEDAPASIGEVYDALAQVGATHGVPGLSVDFHGHRPAGQVDVVLADRELRLHGEPALPKGVGDDTLTETDLGETSRGGRGAAGQLVWPTTAAADSLVGSGGEARALRGVRAGHALAHGGAPVARVHPGAEKPLPQGVPGDPALLGESLLADALPVLLDKVIEVRWDRAWKGNVFNLTTSSGTYTANGIVAHNCRCRVTFRSKSTGKFQATPAGQVTRRPA